MLLKNLLDKISHWYIKKRLLLLILIESLVKQGGTKPAAVAAVSPIAPITPAAKVPPGAADLAKMNAELQKKKEAEDKKRELEDKKKQDADRKKVLLGLHLLYY